MRPRVLDLLTVSILAFLAMGLALFGIQGPGRTISGLLLVFLLSGYASSAALFPNGALDAVERITVSIGLSLILAALGTFILHWTPWGLGVRSWAGLLGTITLVGSGLGLWRTRHARVPLALPNKTRRLFNPVPYLLLGMAMGLAVLACWLARSSAASQNQIGFTQLWILPAQEDPQGMLDVGIRNAEPTPMLYNLQVQLEGQLWVEQSRIDLQPGQVWGSRLTLPAELPSGAPIEARLYRLDDPQVVYRRVLLWHRRIAD
jgi:hypothetical protein